jgi:hypothetical protein
LRRRRPAVPMLVVCLAAAALPAAASAAPMSILYDEQDAVRAITDPSGPGAPIGGDRGAFRQDPGAGGIFDPAGRDARFRIAKVSTSEIDDLAPEAMADRIQEEIDEPEIPNSSGLVGIDEIGNTFNDGRVRITYSWQSVRGKRIRVASTHRLVVTRRGGRIARRGPAPLPVVDPGSPGARLSTAMEILASRPYPGGGSYADRVHLYIAPAFSTSIAAGRGPHRHLGNDGKPHRATWRGVMPALARAGGVWVEMYRPGGGGIQPMSAREWRTVPAAMSAYARRFGADTGRMHLLFSAAGAGPAGAPAGCGAPMTCQWALAASTPAGAALLANGPGAYRVGAEATAWRVEYNRVLGGL